MQTGPHWLGKLGRSVLSKTSAKKWRLVSKAALLAPWSERVPLWVSLYVGQVSTLVSQYTKRVEPLACTTTEAHEHTIQLLEAVGTLLPPYL